MWWRSLLAAIGVAWDVLKCVACGVLFLKKKGDIDPPGWVIDGAEALCPSCKKKNPEDPSDLPDGDTFGV